MTNRLKNPYFMFNYTTALFFWLFVIIYGSFIPFHFHFQPFESTIPYLNLSIGSRADWVANILLYIPLTFFANGWLEQKIKSSGIRNIFIFFMTMLIVISIEYMQQYFSPRTVSLNDIQAECIGSIIGIALWGFFQPWIKHKFQQLFINQQQALKATFIIYLCGYLFFSFFPFDFIVSLSELSTKIQSQNVGLFFSGKAHSPIKFIIEIMLVIPLGFLYCQTRQRTLKQLQYLLMIVFIVSLTIECLQLLIASGVVQGVSAFTRTTGFILGYYLYQLNKSNPLMGIFLNKKVLRFGFFPLYLLFVLLSLNFSNYHLQNIYTIAERFEKLSLIPFYYHYFTTETIAMISLLAHFLLYFPIGLFFGLWYYQFDDSIKTTLTLLTAFMLSILIEFSLLFFSTQHADLTNILIALMSSLSALYLVHLIKYLQQSHQTSKFSPIKPHRTSDNHELPQQNHMTLKTKQRRRHKVKHVLFFGKIGYKIVALLGLAMVIYSVIHFPVAPIFIGVSLVAYAILIYYRSPYWLLVVLAAIPILDITSLTGRMYWDSLDLLLTTTLVVFLWRGIRASQVAFNHKKMLYLIIGLSLSWAISMLIPLIPMPALNSNTFVSELSVFHSLRIGKGYFWALLLFPLLFATIQSHKNAHKYFIRGLAIGLAGTAFAVILERVQFSGLFNFTHSFRVTGHFSSMHTGGGHIEAYLVLVLPLIICALSLPFSRLEKSLYLMVIGMALYALLVTYARGGYLAFFGALVILSLPFFRHFFHFRQWQWSSLIVIFGLIAFIFILTQSHFVQSRFATINKDLNTRMALWNNALNIMDKDISSRIFGMGLGQYPHLYNSRNKQHIKLGTFQFVPIANNTHVELQGGEVLYFEQKLKLRKDQIYHLIFDIKANQKNAFLNISICEKSMLYSFHCHQLKAKASQQWQTKIMAIPTYFINQDNSFFQRPVKLSLYVLDRSNIISIDNLSITDIDGTELISNGDFEQKMDHWFYSIDNHLPWHIEQLGVQLYFSQGLFGLVLFCGLMILILFQLWRSILQNNMLSLGLFSSIIAFLIAGIFSSIFDAPRLTLLFFIIVFYSFMQAQKYQAKK